MTLCWLFVFANAADGATVKFVTQTVSTIQTFGTLSGGLQSAYLVALSEGQSAINVRFKVFGDRIIESSELPYDEWQTTSADQQTYAHIHPPLEIGRRAVVVAGEKMIEGVRLAELLISNQWIDSLGATHLIDSIALSFESKDISEDDLRARSDILRTTTFSDRLDILRSSSAASPECLIVTNNTLAPSFEPLRQYRTGLGIPTEIVIVEDILSQYAGRDSAERLRNCLKSFYDAGGKYVLLGGDGTIVPIRYAYPYATDTTPDLHDQLVCDLYFADLTGEWDTDSDNVWGERYEDQPDVTPELSVGRLPVDSPEEVTAFVAKLIRYETNPGDGDMSYLNRTLFYSADQMRDFSGGGQHGKIAAAFPGGFQVDTTVGVEAQSGSDLNPSNTGPLELPSATRAGYGIVNVIAHGRFDGFVLKSSGYNEFPKQYVLTGGYSDIQCAFDSVGQESSPSFYYSLACDNGGFDLDRPPFTTGGTNMGRALLGSSRGAVAMVGNTRWGWINSSFFLHKAFFDSLFAHPDEPAIAAMYRAQQTFWYYRDLVYGQVFLGDPLTRIYTSMPRKLTVTAKDSAGFCVATVSSPQGREQGIVLTLSDSSGLLESRVSSNNGSVTFATELALGRSYAVFATGSRTTVGHVALTPSITTDVREDRDMMPSDYSLYQNYPNPFNPSTVISFDLPKATKVTLTIINLLGQEISRPVEQFLPAGLHRIEWDGRDNYGRPVASGVYFYRLSSDEFSATRKLALVR